LLLHSILSKSFSCDFKAFNGAELMQARFLGILVGFCREILVGFGWGLLGLARVGLLDNCVGWGLMTLARVGWEIAVF
jgi:hypothetical protein